MPPQPLPAPRSPHAIATHAAARRRVDVVVGRETVKAVRVAREVKTVKEAKAARMQAAKISVAPARRGPRAHRTPLAVLKALTQPAPVCGNA